jgi:hypothetical protein
VDPPPAASGPVEALKAAANELSGATGQGCSGLARPRGRLAFVTGGGWSLMARSRRSAGLVLRCARRASAGAALTSTLRTAGCGPACPVVWEGKSRDHLLSPIPTWSCDYARDAQSSSSDGFRGRVTRSLVVAAAQRRARNALGTTAPAQNLDF